MLQALVTRRRQLLGMRIAEQQRASGPDKRMRRSLNIVLKALDREFARLDKEISLSLMSTMRSWPPCSTASRTWAKPHQHFAGGGGLTAGE